MLDERNRQLAEVTRVDDVIVSDKIISLMLTQISETRELAQVFNELFAAEGSEIYLRPASDYVAPGARGRATRPSSLGGAAPRSARSATAGELADDPDSEFGVRINPAKSEPVSLGEGDRVIVLAEE